MKNLLHLLDFPGVQLKANRAHPLNLQLNPISDRVESLISDELAPSCSPRTSLFLEEEDGEVYVNFSAFGTIIRLQVEFRDHPEQYTRKCIVQDDQRG